MTVKRNRAIDATLTLPGISRPVGRPRDPNAKTAAQRQSAFRARQLGETMEATVQRLASQFDLPIVEVKRHLIRFALCNRNWAQTGFPSVSQKPPKPDAA